MTQRLAGAMRTARPQRLVCAWRALALAALALASTPAAPAPPPPPPPVRATLAVYGSTVAAASACLAAARMGELCVIVEPREHLWGMTSGGLGGVDLRMQLGGIAREIFGDRPFPNFAPSQLNATITALLNAEPSIAVLTGAGGLVAVERNASHVLQLRFAGGLSISARVFIDASYDGDLLRLSNTSYALGREAAAQYGEPLGGVNGGLPWAAGALRAVSPWADAANTTLIAGVAPLPGPPLPEPGAADGLVQTYNYRLTLTNVSANRLPFAPPADYTPAATEFLRRWFRANAAAVGGMASVLELFLVRHLGDGKVDINQGTGFPGLSDLPNLQAGWPLADWPGRAAIEAAHEFATRAAWEFLRSDAAVPPRLRADAATWGLAADEFTATRGFPPQLYVRESVRLVGARVLTQADVFGRAAATSNESVGLSQWLVDIHDAQRVALPPALTGGAWAVGDAGGVNTAGKPWQLTEVPYGALTPRRAETANLLVPVCASLSHVAWATYRLEPQYAVFGHSAGVAAVLAARGSGVVQDVGVPALQAELRRQGQLLDAAAPTAAPLALRSCAGGGALLEWAHDARDGAFSLRAGAHNAGGSGGGGGGGGGDGNGTCASVYAYSNATGAALWGARCHLDAAPHNQAFDFEAPGPAPVRSRMSGLCVVAAAAVAPGVGLQQVDCAVAHAWTLSAGGAWASEDAPGLCVAAVAATTPAEAHTRC